MPEVEAQPSRAQLVTLAASSEPSLRQWAVRRLDGDDALIGLLCHEDPAVARQAAGAIVRSLLVPSAAAVAAAWDRVSDELRLILAVAAARAGWVEGARRWAAAAGSTAVQDWLPVARELLVLEPEALARAAATLPAAAGDAPSPAGDEDAAAWSRARLRAAWPDAAAELAAGLWDLRDRQTMPAIAETLLIAAPVRHLSQALAEDGPRRLASLSGLAEVLARAGVDPLVRLRGAQSCHEAIGELLGHLPRPTASQSPQAAFLDRQRRAVLEALATGPVPAPDLPRQAYLLTWTVALALVCALWTPRDWWAALERRDAGPDHAAAALADLDGTVVDLPPFAPLVVSGTGPDLAGAVLGLLAAGPQPGGPPPDYLLHYGVTAAAAALARAGRPLEAADADRLITLGIGSVPAGPGDGAEGLPPLLRLARHLPPEAIARCADLLTDTAEGARYAALHLLRRGPAESAGPALAARLDQLTTDAVLWPTIAEAAVDQACAGTAAALLPLWQPGETELGAALQTWQGVAEAVGWPVPAGIATPLADLAANPLPPRPADARRGPSWPLRLPLQCQACKAISTYAVERLNVCTDPALQRGRGEQVHLNIGRDVVIAPRFHCRHCGAEGRGRIVRHGFPAVLEAVEAWNLRHNDQGHGHDHAGHSHLEAPQAEIAKSGVEWPEDPAWHGRVAWINPRIVDGARRSVSHLVEADEARAAAGEASFVDRLALAECWLDFGDPEAARARLAGLEDKLEELAPGRYLLARLAEATGDLGAARQHWTAVLRLGGRPGMPPGLTALARDALQRLGAPLLPGPSRVLLPGAAGRSGERVVVIGRNDPCPCGSGKKYKRCCGIGA